MLMQPRMCTSDDKSGRQSDSSQVCPMPRSMTNHGSDALPLYVQQRRRHARSFVYVFLVFDFQSQDSQPRAVDPGATPPARPRDPGKDTPFVRLTQNSPEISAPSREGGGKAAGLLLLPQKTAPTPRTQQGNAAVSAMAARHVSGRPGAKGSRSSCTTDETLAPIRKSQARSSRSTDETKDFVHPGLRMELYRYWFSRTPVNTGANAHRSPYGDQQLRLVHLGRTGEAYDFVHPVPGMELTGRFALAGRKLAKFRAKFARCIGSSCSADETLADAVPDLVHLESRMELYPASFSRTLANIEANANRPPCGDKRKRRPSGVKDGTFQVNVHPGLRMKRHHDELRPSGVHGWNYPKRNAMNGHTWVTTSAFTEWATKPTANSVTKWSVTASGQVKAMVSVRPAVRTKLTLKEAMVHSESGMKRGKHRAIAARPVSWMPCKQRGKCQSSTVWRQATRGSFGLRNETNGKRPSGNHGWNMQGNDEALSSM